jgi:hypothetical protein
MELSNIDTKAISWEEMTSLILAKCNPKEYFSKLGKKVPYEDLGYSLEQMKILEILKKNPDLIGNLLWSYYPFKKEQLQLYSYCCSRSEWRLLSYNSALPWSLELIEKYKDKWDWEILSKKTNLPWSLELIRKFEDKWHWKYLLYNSDLPWSLELIEQYEDRWDWASLSCNYFLPWSLKLIEKYKDKWEWKYLSYNSGLPWSLGLIEKYEDKWSWQSFNIDYNWSLNFIRKQTAKLPSRYSEKFYGIIKPHLNDSFVDAIMYERIVQQHHDNSNVGVSTTSQL